MKQHGFTIVELLTVMGVIAILAVFTTVSYGIWIDDVDSSAIRSDLKASAAQLEDHRNFNNGYPLTNGINTINGGQGLPKGDDTSYRYTSDGAMFCLTAYSSNTRIPSAYIQSGQIDRTPEGSCPGHTRP